MENTQKITSNTNDISIFNDIKKHCLAVAKSNNNMIKQDYVIDTLYRYGLSNDEYDSLIDFLIDNNVVIDESDENENKSSEEDDKNEDDLDAELENDEDDDDVSKKTKKDVGSDIQTTFLNIKKSKLLTKEEEVEVAKRIERGDPFAIEKMVNSNSGLVLKAAYKYYQQRFDILDLVQAGYQGLLKAIKKFDYRRGFRFCTCATPWIAQAVSEYVVTNNGCVRFPPTLVSLNKKIFKVASDFALEHGREPTNEEIINEFGPSLSTKRLREVQSTCFGQSSIDDILNEDDETTFMEVIADPNDISPEDYLKNEDIKQVIENILSTKLTEKERVIIEKVFGLNGNDSYATLEEVGNELCVSKERIRQIKDRAIEKIKDAFREINKSNGDI